MRFELVLILLLLSLAMLSMADHNTDSSDDDHSSKEDHSGDDPEEMKTEEDSGTEKKSDEDSAKNKEKEKNKKEEKDKGKHEDVNYDDDAESSLSDSDIDAAFIGTQPTKNPEDVDNSKKTTPEPLQGIFTPGPSNIWSEYFNNLGSSGSGGNDKSNDSSISPLSETTPTPKDDSDMKNEREGQGGSHGTISGNSFYPYPRPVDIWDRLIVMAAFPICFFALMLKAEMFR